MGRLAFDLDGTLYDTFPLSLRAENIHLERYGYRALSADELKRAFQSQDFKRYYRGLGVQEEYLETMISEFYPIFDSLGLPELIPGAKELLLEAERTFGEGNISFVTNATTENLQCRFHRDGLEKYLPQVRNCLQGKSEMLLNLAAEHESRLVYVGDLVSDGEECLAARERGAETLYFCGLTHSYAFSLAEAMRDFVEQHSNFARAAGSFEELLVLLSSWGVNI